MGDTAFVTVLTSTPPVTQDIGLTSRLAAGASRSHAQMVTYQP
jgi:hypothetical protein